MTVEPTLIPGQAEVPSPSGGMTPQEFTRLFTRFRFALIQAAQLTLEAAGTIDTALKKHGFPQFILPIRQPAPR